MTPEDKKANRERRLAKVRASKQARRKEPLQIVAPSARPNAHIQKLAVVTCMFNPHKSRRRIDNYRLFAHAMRSQGADLFTAEGVFAGNGDIDGSQVYNIDPDAVFWHKESLLNLAIARLPDAYDAVMWIDADIIYPLCVFEHVVDALRRYPVIQPYEGIQYLESAGEAGRFVTTFAKKNINSEIINPCAAGACPGGVWAARRDVLAKVGGMYDLTITGSGDAAWCAGVWGNSESQMPGIWSEPLIRDVFCWGKDLFDITQGDVPYLNVTCTHLYHGKRIHRQYCQRHKVLRDSNYDPREHVTTASNGTLRWSSKAPAQLKNAVREYMFGRKEDQ